MEHGLGIVTELRQVGQRFAQRAVADVLDGHRREFVIDAGSTIEFLAKAVVGQDDPVEVIKPTARSRVTEHERALLLAPHHRQSILTHRYAAAARNQLSKRQTISALCAIERAAARLGDSAFESAAKGIWRSRNAAVHLGHDPGPDLHERADWFVQAAETLWCVLGRNTVELWGWAVDVAELGVLGRAGHPRERARARVARARLREAELGTATLRRRSLLHRIPETRCPVCEADAFLTPAQASEAPLGVREPHLYAEPVRVLDCLICGLVLWEDEIDQVSDP